MILITDIVKHTVAILKQHNNGLILSKTGSYYNIKIAAPFSVQLYDYLTINDFDFLITAKADDVYTVKYSNDVLIVGNTYQIKTRSPYFEFGTWEETRYILTEKDQSGKFRFTKYPLVLLLPGFRMSIDNSKPINVVSNIDIYIIDKTIKDLGSFNRLETTFKTVLIPLCEAFVSNLKDNRFVAAEANKSIPYQISFYPYLIGEGENQNKLIDTVDALHINIPNLSLLKIC